MAKIRSEIDKLNYEDAYSELEEIVGRLENDQISLEESMQLFERGQALSNHCSKLLENAELKLRSIQPKPSQLINDEELKEHD
jgi:exodeoxyribonuclease VII small subunit